MRIMKTKDVVAKLNEILVGYNITMAFMGTTHL